MMDAAKQARCVRPWLIASLACAALLFSASGPTAAAPKKEEERSLAEAVAAIERSPQAALELVRDRLSYRPYAGFVKGPRGAWWDRTANAADAADLLLDVLRRKRIPARLAFGALPDAQAAALLTSVFKRGKLAAKVQQKLPGSKIADPVADKALRAIAARHTWVQANWQGRWIDLDPVAVALLTQSPAHVAVFYGAGWVLLFAEQQQALIFARNQARKLGARTDGPPPYDEY